MEGNNEIIDYEDIADDPTMSGNMPLPAPGSAFVADSEVSPRSKDQTRGPLVGLNTQGDQQAAVTHPTNDDANFDDPVFSQFLSQYTDTTFPGAQDQFGLGSLGEMSAEGHDEQTHSWADNLTDEPKHVGGTASIPTFNNGGSLNDMADVATSAVSNTQAVVQGEDPIEPATAAEPGTRKRKKKQQASEDGPDKDLLKQSSTERPPLKKHTSSVDIGGSLTNARTKAPLARAKSTADLIPNGTNPPFHVNPTPATKTTSGLSGSHNLAAQPSIGYTASRPAAHGWAPATLQAQPVNDWMRDENFRRAFTFDGSDVPKLINSTRKVIQAIRKSNEMAIVDLQHLKSLLERLPVEHVLRGDVYAERRRVIRLVETIPESTIRQAQAVIQSLESQLDSSISQQNIGILTHRKYDEQRNFLLTHYRTLHAVWIMQEVHHFGRQGVRREFQEALLEAYPDLQQYYTLSLPQQSAAGVGNAGRAGSGHALQELHDQGPTYGSGTRANQGRDAFGAANNIVLHNNPSQRTRSYNEGNTNAKAHAPAAFPLQANISTQQRGSTPVDRFFMSPNFGSGPDNMESDHLIGQQAPMVQYAATSQRGPESNRYGPIGRGPRLPIVGGNTPNLDFMSFPQETNSQSKVPVAPTAAMGTGQITQPQYQSSYVSVARPNVTSSIPMLSDGQYADLLPLRGSPTSRQMQWDNSPLDAAQRYADSRTDNDDEGDVEIMNDYPNHPY